MIDYNNIDINQFDSSLFDKDINAQNMEEMQALYKTIDVLCRSESGELFRQFMEFLEDIVPKNFLGYDLLGYGYNKLKDPRRAVHFMEKCVACAGKEESFAVRYNLAKCYLKANEPFKCKSQYEIVHRMNPDDVDIMLDMSVAYYACNEKDRSKEILIELVNKPMSEKNRCLVCFNLATHIMREGDIKKGMEYISLGRKIRIWGSYTHNFPIPEWDGTPQEGKKVLIVGEGGIGDEIINLRFVEHIKEMGMECHFASCHVDRTKGLYEIYRRLPFDSVSGYEKWTTNIPTIKEYDYWTPCMSLPKTLGVEKEDIFRRPYITSNPEYVEKWEDRITGDFKVGLRWSGNPAYEHDLNRTIPIEDVNKVIPEGWTKYSLQLDDPRDIPDIIDLESELESFEDTLAVMEHLDLVITSCTSIAHAAAALGKEVIIMTPIMDYYTWVEGKSKTSWYGDNVTLVRQQTPKKWDEPIEELKEILQSLHIT